MKNYPRIMLFLVALLAGGWIVTSLSLNNPALDPLGKPLGTDFVNQWAAAKLSLQGQPEAAYDMAIHAQMQRQGLGLSQTASPEDDFGYYGWHYPPVALLLVTPLGGLPYLLALVLWLILTGGLLWGALRLWLPEISRAALLPIAIGFPAVLVNLGHGQNGFLSSALLLAALAGIGWEKQGRGWLLSGICIGLMTFKPQFGVLLPFALLAGGYWRSFISAAAVSLLLILLTLLLYGTAPWMAFLESTAFTREVILEGGATGWQKIQSPFAWIRAFGGTTGLAYSVQIITALLALAAVIDGWRRYAPFAAKAALLGAATLLATPYLLDYDLMLLAIPLTCLTALGLQGGFKQWEISALCMAWILPLVARSLAHASMEVGMPLFLTPLLALWLTWLCWQRCVKG